MKRKIIIRADGGTLIGMGHVVRCLALADMLKDDFDIVFAIQEPTENILKAIHTVTQAIIHLPVTNDITKDALNFSQYLGTNDIVVLDGYNFKTDYQKAIKIKGCKLVCIDDLHAWHHFADAIINHAEGVDQKQYSAEAYTQFYLGIDYVLLRKEFLTFKKKNKRISTIKKVFISMGAADVNNITQKFTEALIQIDDIEEIHLILGSINPNLNSINQLIGKQDSKKITTHFDIPANELALLLNQCDISICPASSISLESCAIGIVLISGYTAENQLGILNGLIKHETCISFGNFIELSVADIKIKIESLFKEPNKINALVANQRTMIDGHSPERLLNIFKNINKIEQLQFRFANEKDADLYFKWVNDIVVRENSYNKDIVAYENHIKWFKSKILSKDCSFYLFFNHENVPVGQVRIDKSLNETIIGISIDEAFRGKSFGAEMLKKAAMDYLQKHPKSTIVAYIKIENQVSYSIFKKAGFMDDKIVTEHGFKSYKLSKKLYQ